MKPTELGQLEAPPEPPRCEAQEESPALVTVLTDFLREASKHVLEDDWESYYT